MPLESSRIDDDFTSIRGRVQVQMNHQLLQYPHRPSLKLNMWFGLAGWKTPCRLKQGCIYGRGCWKTCFASLKIFLLVWKGEKNNSPGHQMPHWCLPFSNRIWVSCIAYPGVLICSQKPLVSKVKKPLLASQGSEDLLIKPHKLSWCCSAGIEWEKTSDIALIVCCPPQCHIIIPATSRD